MGDRSCRYCGREDPVARFVPHRIRLGQGVPAGREHGLPGRAHGPLEIHPLLDLEGMDELYDLDATRMK